MATTTTYTTGRLAAMIGVHQQTVVRWHREGILRPTQRRKLGARQYTERDAIAALIAKEALERRIDTSAVKEIVRAVQQAAEGDSEIVMLEGRTPGFVINAWVADPASDEARSELARWERNGHVILRRTRLRDIVKRLREQLAD